MRPGTSVRRGRERVCVVGSLNIDYVSHLQALPRPGETVHAIDVTRHFGGKGANQAVAAARQGATVTMIGAVGDDGEGREYLAHLRRERIGVEGVIVARKVRTGSAFISVDRLGENSIVVAAGANFALRPSHIRAARKEIESAGALVLQAEVPDQANLEAIRIASRAGVPVIFNPAPWPRDFAWGKESIDWCVVNEGEAEALLGRAPALVDKASSARIRRKLKQRGIGTLVITRGARSTLCFSESDSFEVSPFEVRVVDTVGAGDAFVGTLARAIAAGLSPREAVTLANCGGALATRKMGAQESLPTKAEIDRFLRGKL